MSNSGPILPYIVATVSALMFAASADASEPFDAKLVSAPSGVPLIDARINGSLDVEFVLDTGASNTTIRPAIANQLKLTPEKQDESVGLSGQKTIPIYRLAKVSFAGTEAKDILAGGIEGPSFDGRNVVGLLGVDAIGSRMAEFDLKNMRLRLYSPDRREPPAGYAEPATLEWNRPWRILIAGTADGHPIHAMIDTGAEHTVANPALAAFLKDASADGKSGIRGLDGAATELTAKKIETLRLGNWTIKNAAIGSADLGLFQRMGPPERKFLLLGADILHGRSFVVDYAAQRVWLKPE